MATHHAKYVVVTGATRGIGRAIAEAFAAHGANVAFCARTEAHVKALETELRSRYPDADIFGAVADMGRKEDIVAFADTVKSRWPELNVLVNNAGVFLPCDLTKDADEAVFETMMNVNLYSAFRMTRGLMSLLKQSTTNAQTLTHIFNICSVASLVPFGGYSVSKFALLGYSKVLREELKPSGIRVSSVLPGATLTDAWGKTSLPESRFIDAADIAQSILSVYLLSAHTVVEDIVLRPQLGDI